MICTFDITEHQCHRFYFSKYAFACLHIKEYSINLFFICLTFATQIVFYFYQVPVNPLFHISYLGSHYFYNSQHNCVALRYDPLSKGQWAAWVITSGLGASCEYKMISFHTAQKIKYFQHVNEPSRLHILAMP